MKKSFYTIIAICLLLVSCKNETKTTEGTTSDLTEVAENQTDIPLLTLGEFDTKAGDFVEKEVNVKGIVDHVCKHGGKKILLVTDDGDVHIFSDTRFDDALMGSEITVTGVVKEEVIDESYCLKMEEDNIKSHKEGVANKDQYEMKMKHIQSYRDSMKVANVDHLSFYTLDYVSHK